MHQRLLSPPIFLILSLPVEIQQNSQPLEFIFLHLNCRLFTPVCTFINWLPSFFYILVSFISPSSSLLSFARVIGLMPNSMFKTESCPSTRPWANNGMTRCLNSTLSSKIPSPQTLARLRLAPDLLTWPSHSLHCLWLELIFHLTFSDYAYCQH